MIVVLFIWFATLYSWSSTIEELKGTYLAPHNRILSPRMYVQKNPTGDPLPVVLLSCESKQNKEYANLKFLAIKLAHKGYAAFLFAHPERNESDEEDHITLARDILLIQSNLSTKTYCLDLSHVFYFGRNNLVQAAQHLLDDFPGIMHLIITDTFPHQHTVTHATILRPLREWSFE